MREAQLHHDLADYLVRITRHPALDREQELALARRFATGERKAGELLVCAHLRDVVVIARGYRGYGQPLAELVAAGNLGLVRALGRFDAERGLRFMTYAGYWVRAEMLSHVIEHWSVVELGRSSLQTRLFFGLARERARLESLGVRGPELVAALAEHFGCAPEHIATMQQRLEVRDVDLDGVAEPHDPGRDDPERALERAQQVAWLWAELDTVLTRLEPRERLIVERRLLAEREPSLAEVGLELGLSRERVRQLEHQAHRKLRRWITASA